MFDEPFPRRNSFGFRTNGSRINRGHPLAANLVFFAVPTPSGFFDLVGGQPLIVSGAYTPVPTPLGVGGMFGGPPGTALANAVGYAYTLPAAGRYQPAAGLTVAAGVYNLPGITWTGSTARFAHVNSGTPASPTDTTGCLAVRSASGNGQCVAGGNGSTIPSSSTYNIEGVNKGGHSCLVTYTPGTADLENIFDNNQGGSNGSSIASWSGLNFVELSHPRRQQGARYFGPPCGASTSARPFMRSPPIRSS